MYSNSNKKRNFKNTKNTVNSLFLFEHIHEEFHTRRLVFQDYESLFFAIKKMKKTTSHLIFILIFFISSFTGGAKLLAHVDKTYFLQAKVDEKTIVLKIKCYNESPVRYLNYFFVEEKRDHYMEGNPMGNAWNFTSTDNQKEINLVIREEKDGSWKGFWREDANKKINLILTPIVINPESKYYYYAQNKELDLYDAYKISILNLEKTKTEKIAKNFKLDWYSEKESNISLFRLESENKKTKLDSINNVLEAIQLSLIYNYFQYNPNRESLTFEPQITLLNETLISFKLISNTVLKNQNPIKAQQAFVLDLQNGAQITLEDIIWLDEKNTKPDANAISETYEYRKKIFAPQIFSILSELYPQQMQSAECNVNKEITWAIPNFILTEKGIQFSFSNSATCNVMDWAIIPYEKLKPYLQKKYSVKF